MEASKISNEDRQKIVQIFSELRKNLDVYMDDRKFIMSNSQIFTFLTYAPVCLAIASDREVDESEIRLLAQITKNIDVNELVNLELMEIIAITNEPEKIILNEEFNMRIDAEMLFLSRNIDKYEESIISAVKNLLKIDSDPQADTSLTKTLSSWFDFVIKKNAKRTKQIELDKIAKYKQKIGL